MPFFRLFILVNDKESERLKSEAILVIDILLETLERLIINEII